jgi:hypothetical protein
MEHHGVPGPPEFMRQMLEVQGKSDRQTQQHNRGRGPWGAPMSFAAPFWIRDLSAKNFDLIASAEVTHIPADSRLQHSASAKSPESFSFK